MRVTVVRVYCTEGEHKLQGILKHLHDVEKVRGVTVFRGIAGFGASGKMHASSLLDMSLDLPLVLEFFDHPDKISRVLDHLEPQVEPGHILHWSADLNMEAE